MNKIRILLADDHPVVRAGLRMFLESEEDLEVIGEAATGWEAVTLAKELSPDVVVMDISMPGNTKSPRWLATDLTLSTAAVVL